MRRYELTKEPFGPIEDLTPMNGRPGAQWNDHRTTLTGIFRYSAQRSSPAVNFLATAKLAIIQRCLRLLDSSDRPWSDERLGSGRAIHASGAD